MNRITAFVVIIFGLIAGCNTKHYDKEVAEVDSLLTVMQNANTKLMSVDSAKVERYFANSEHLLDYLDANYKDTMELETAVLVSEYAYIKKVLGKYGKQKKEYLELMTFNNKQLAALKADLEHGVSPEDSVPIYLETEAKAVDGLNKSIHAIVENVEIQFVKYDSLHPQVQEMVNALKENIEAE